MESKIYSEKKDLKANIFGIFKKMFVFFARWFFLMSILAVAIFCVFVWLSYIWKADWDETRKQSYINEQAKFSFDKGGYKTIVDMMENRKNKLENFPRFTGRDIFFPEN